MRGSYWGVGACALMSTAPAIAWAQTTPPVGAAEQSGAVTGTSSAPSGPGATLGEVVVTARKVSENLQKAPASITVLSASQLTTNGISVPTDLDKLLPSASLRKEGAVAQTYLRGVGSTLDFPWTAAAVAITYDGVTIPRYGTLGVIFDLSSVEQIAGPQGTLYGGSAAGGAINLLTVRPRNDLSGNALIAGGNYGSLNIAVDQNLPVTEKLSFLTAIDYSRHDGYEGRDFFSSNRIQARESILYTPTKDLTALFFVSAYSENGTSGTTLHLNTRPLASDPYDVPATYPGGAPIRSSLTPQNDKTYVVGANIDLHIGGGTLTYIPGYVHVEDDYAQYVIAGILRVHDEEDQNSQELRWSQQFGRLKLSAGAYWMQNKTDFNDAISLPVLPAALGYYLDVPTIDRTSQTNTSYSVFAQATYSLLDRLRLTVGGRASEDKISAAGTGAAGAFSFHRSEGTLDWKVGVDYDLAPSVLLYANIQTSYIPFGYNPDVGDPAQNLRESRLTAYSTGVKSRFLHDTLEINSEFYFYQYSNFQAFALDNLTNLTVSINARTTIIYGDELSVRWKFKPGTSVDASAVAQKANYTDFSGPGYDFSGFAAANAPKLNLLAGVQHEFDLGRLGSLLTRAQTQFNSGSYGVFEHEGTFQQSYHKTDLIVTYSPYASRWKFQAFVNNVENRATFGGLGPDGPGQPGSGFLAPPRTFGGRITTSWW